MNLKKSIRPRLNIDLKDFHKLNILKNINKRKAIGEIISLIINIYLTQKGMPNIKF
jgi:hypothetical protein